MTLESREKNDVMKVAPMMSFQCSFLVIPVAFFSCHPSALTTWIQKT
ncbi:hypothetical protein H9I48_01130 [Wolbachia pipientis]|nr:hypothetical protein [Wolbachia pipientis]